MRQVGSTTLSSTLADRADRSGRSYAPTLKSLFGNNLSAPSVLNGSGVGA